MKCFGDSEIFEEQVCPICGPRGGIEASDDGNRDQNCGTCGKVLLKLGGQWHKSEKHTSSSLTLKEYHEEYCIKKDNQWVYNA